MSKQEKEAMREGFEKCLNKIEQQRKVIEKLVAYLHRELGTQAAQELIDELNRNNAKGLSYETTNSKR